jgi:hypothetical protein
MKPVIDIEQAGRISAMGGYITGRNASVAIIGDPASLYVCSDAADAPVRYRGDDLVLYDDGGVGDGLRRRLIWSGHGANIVTGSTAPQAPEVDLSAAELQTMIDAHVRAMLDTAPPFTYHYHGEAWWALRKLRDRRLALEPTQATNHPAR